MGTTTTKEIRIWEHRCETIGCYKSWTSKKKAERCPECGQWHIAMSSHLGYGKFEE